MRISVLRLSFVAALVVAFALVGTATASADSTSCAAGGVIKLSPGLTNTPAVQNVTVKGTLAECASVESEVTMGKFVAHFKTAEPIACPVLTSEGVGASPEENKIILKPLPKKGMNPQGTFSLPIKEGGGALLSGEITTLETPFSEDTIGGSITETYVGGPKCGEEVEGHPAKKVKKGTFVGTLSVG
jgi:hypothetical protein